MLRALGVLIALLASAQGLAQPPDLPEADRLRLAEALHLADAVTERVWPGWREVPFVVLLIAPGGEYLVRHPAPPPDFVSLGHDELLRGELLARPLSGAFGARLLAAFPALDGVNTVVAGTAEATGKTSTGWVLSLLHEHFHQLQFSRPGHFAAVDALGLAGGDTTGMWQLDYPFPYAADPPGSAFAAYRQALERALAATTDARARLGAVHAARAALRAVLSAPDDRYLAFQLWQEGVARYTEYAVAEAALLHHRPLPGVTELADWKGYGDWLAAARAALAAELAGADLTRDGRLAVYPVGAAEALLLDRFRPGWRHAYFDHRFDLGPLWEPPGSAEFGR